MTMTMTMHPGPVAMEVVATVSTRLFCLSVELRTKDPPSIPASSAWWVPLLPALLASLLHATVVRPLAVATRHWFRGQTCCSTWLWRVLTTQVLRILLLSEQASLWLLYLLAPHLFDISVKLKVEVETIRAMLRLLLNNTARLLHRLATGLRVSGIASTDDEDPAAAAATAGGRRQQPGGVKERGDGPRRSARHRRPNVRVAGPEWDTTK